MTKHIPSIVLAVGLNGLGAVRSLGVQGIPVYAICNSRDNSILRSKYLAKGYIVPTGVDYEDRLFTFLTKTFPEGGVILPSSDETAEFVKNYKAALFEKGFRFLIPPDDTVSVLNDKRLEVDFIQSLQVPIPSSVTNIKGPDYLENLKPPLIIKPRRFDGYHVINAKNLILESLTDIESFLTQYADRLDLFVAQEIISGPDENLWVCNCLFDENSKLVTSFTFNRLGTSPSHYGVTTSAIGINNKKVRELVRLIGEKIGYVGPAMFEFKKDSNSGDYKYIEINPRIGMCNWFDTQSNVNNVYYYYCLAAGVDTNLNGFQPEQSERGYLNFFSDLYARIEDRQSIGKIISVLFRILVRKPVFAMFYLGDIRPGLIGIKGGLKNGYFRVKNKIIKKLRKLFPMFVK